MAIRYLSGIDVDSNTLFVDDANNRVGIGTGSPTAKLQLYGSGLVEAKVTSTNDQALLYLQGTFGQVANNAGDFYITNSAPSSSLILRTADTERMRITAAGNVGIGVTSPSAKLDVSSAGVAALFVSSSNSVPVSVYNTGNAVSTIGFSGVGSSSDYHVRIGASATSLVAYTDNTERMRITSAGNVGIGTTSPAALLNVGGTGTLHFTESGIGSMLLKGASGTARGMLEVHNGNSSSKVLLQAYTGGAGVGTLSNTTLDIVTNSTTRMVVTSGGNVGIGTTAPSGNLDVSASAGTYIFNLTNASEEAFKLRAYNHGSGAGIAAVFTYGLFYSTQENTAIKFYRGGSSTGGFMTFTTSDGTERMRIAQDGSVGINTTSPSVRLHVQAPNLGTSAGDQTYAALFQAGNGNSSFLEIKDVRTDAGSDWTGAGKRIQMRIDSTYMGYIQFNGSSNNFGLSFGTGGTTSDPGNVSERMRITSAGDVGIGTTSPAYKLDVTGTARVTSTLLGGGRISAATEYRLNDNSYSRVAIIDGSGAFGGGYNFNINSGTPQHDSTGAVSAYYYNSAGYISFYTNSSQSAGTAASERMRITSDGNVGIGTTAPGSKLSVSGSNSGSVPLVDLVASGSGAFQRGVRMLNSGMTAGDSIMYAAGRSDNSKNMGQFYFYYAGDGSNSNRISMGLHSVDDVFNINGSGNVGIGTTAPSQLLHVAGNVRVTGAYYDSSNSAGSSGQVLSSTGSGTAWVNQGEATATSLYDLLPAARVAFNWTGQVVNDTWTTVFSKSSNLLTTGTWMVKMYVSDFATGGGHYTYTYSGMFTWYQETTNQAGEQAASEIYLHRMGHAANASVLYLRTTETAAASSGDGLFQIKGNYSNTSNQTIQFQFVKIF